MYRLSESSRRNRAGIDQRLIAISDLAIEISLIDFGHGPLSGLRTRDEQLKLYVDGKSKADGARRLSKHQSGLALDFYAVYDGKASWERAHLAMVAAAHMQAAARLGHAIEWGGLWPSKAGGIYGWDMCHIELSQ